MTAAKTRKPAQAPTDPPVDPLADLREDPDDLTQPAPEAPAVEPAGGALLRTQESHDQDRAVMIAAWHADTVALGFLHKGGRCGCHYLANVALGAVLPIRHDPDTDDTPADDAGTEG